MRSIGFVLVALLAFNLWGQEVDYDFTAEAEVPSQTSVDIGDVSPGALGRLTVRPDGRAIAVSGWVQCSDGTSWNGGSDELTVEVVFEYGFGTDIVATCDGHDVEGHQCAYWTGADQPGIHNPFFKGRYATTGTAPGQGGEAIWTLIANQNNLSATIMRRRDGEKDYKEINAVNQNVNVLPGELIDLKIVPINEDDVLEEFEWTIGGRHFNDYIRGSAQNPVHQGRVLPLVKGFRTKNTIQFYWSDGSSGQVACTYSVNNVAAKATTNLDIKMPTYILGAEIGHVKWFPNRQEIQLTGARPGKPDGILFAGTVRVPNGFQQGHWAIVQRVKSEMVSVDASDTVNNWYGLQCLDGVFPYSPVFNTGQLGGASDSPGLNVGNYPNEKRIINRDAFTTYLMFLPAGNSSRPVSLAVIEWQMRFQLVKRNGTWAPTSFHPKKNRVVNSKATSQHPEWEEIFAPQNVIFNNGPLRLTVPRTIVEGKKANGAINIPLIAGAAFQIPVKSSDAKRLIVANQPIQMKKNAKRAALTLVSPDDQQAEAPTEVSISTTPPTRLYCYHRIHLGGRQ